MAIQRTEQDTTPVGGDGADSPYLITVNRLDADQYTADDLDGVTEGLFGSGNMAYASLQASQTDEALFVQDSFSLSDDNVFGRDARVQNTESGGRSLENGETTGNATQDTQGNFSSVTVGSLGASTLSSDVGSFAPGSNLRISADNFFQGSSAATSKSSISSARTDETTTTNVDNSTTETNVTNETTNTFIDLGDEITVVNDQITNLFDTVNTTVTNVTNTVTDIVNNLLDGGLGLSLDADVLDTLGASLDATLENGLQIDATVDAVTDNVAQITEALTGLNIPALSVIDAGVSLNLLSGEDVNDGGDITVAGLDLPAIDLDIVEDIIGDIDINLAIPDITDIEGLVSDVGDTLASLGDLDIADAGEILDIVGDQTVSVALDAVIGNTELGQDILVTVDDVQDGLGDLVDDVVETIEAVAGDIVPDEITDVVDDLLGGGGGDGGLIAAVVNTVDDGVAGVSDILDGEGSLIEDVTETVEAAVDNVVDEIIPEVTEVLGDIAGGDIPLVDDLLGGGDEGGLIEAVVDTVEAVIGDGVLDDALGILGSGDGEADIVEEITGWTEAAVDGVGGLFDDVLGGADGGDIIPDPIGSIGEGLGLLDTDNDSGGSLLGGLFG